MSDGPREIGRVQAGTDVLAVSQDRGDILLGQPGGWPVRLGASARDELMRLLGRAEFRAEAWAAEQEPAVSDPCTFEAVRSERDSTPCAYPRGHTGLHSFMDAS